MRRKVSVEALQQFMKELAASARSPGNVYFTGGATALLLGSRDLETDCSLLVLIAAPRLKRLGIHLPDGTFPQCCEHRLYDRLEQRLGAGAHSYYNSLIRRIVSYTRALEREQTQG